MAERALAGGRRIVQISTRTDGGALIGALSSLPFVLPLAHADSPVQAVSLDDVVDVVARTAAGNEGAFSRIAAAVAQNC